MPGGPLPLVRKITPELSARGTIERLLPAGAGEATPPARAQFMYQDTQGARLTLYVSVLPPGPPVPAGFGQTQAGDTRSFYWREGRLGYALSGPVSQPRLDALLDLVALGTAGLRTWNSTQVSALTTSEVAALSSVQVGSLTQFGYGKCRQPLQRPVAGLGGDLRLQVLRSGFALDEAWQDVNALDDALERRLSYAFHAQFGYLTACPTNVGTGMRASVMLHLPALGLTKQIDKVFRALQKINLAVRGLHGEGSRAFGDLYQISNHVTLGKSEEKLLGEIREVIVTILQYERQARAALVKERRQAEHDRVARAIGTLGSATMITAEETMELLSAVRLGIHLHLLDGIPVTAVNQLFIHTQSAHLQKLAGHPLDGEHRTVDLLEHRDHLRQRALDVTDKAERVAHFQRDTVRSLAEILAAAHHVHPVGEAQHLLELAGMVLNGQIHHQEHLVRGLENAPDALNLLFTGGNHGKTLVVVDDSVVLA